MALTLYLPTTASPVKVAKLREGGATVVLHGEDCVEVGARGSRGWVGWVQRVGRKCQEAAVCRVDAESRAALLRASG